MTVAGDNTTLGELLRNPWAKTGDSKVGQNEFARAPGKIPLTGADGELLRILARGDFLIKGFPAMPDVRAAP